MKKLVANLLCATAVVAGTAGLSGKAQAVIITNGSFESGADPGGSFSTLSAGSGDLTGWNIVTGSIDYIGGYWAAQDGHRSIDLNGNDVSAISQQLTGLTPGQQYKVSFWLSGNPDHGHIPNPKTLDVFTTFINSQSYAFNSLTNNAASMGWLENFFYFTADGTGTALLTFKSTTTGDCCWGPALDNISVAATPLPAALPLFGSALGAFGLLGWFRRRLGATTA
jgi:choice-of-anchor C domain-containing protein